MKGFAMLEISKTGWIEKSVKNVDHLMLLSSPTSTSLPDVHRMGAQRQTQHDSRARRLWSCRKEVGELVKILRLVTE